MKQRTSLKYLLSCLLFLQASLILAQTEVVDTALSNRNYIDSVKKSKITYVKVTISIKEGRKSIDNAQLQIYKPNEPTALLTTSDNGKLSYILTLNSEYIIQVYKPGYVPKIISYNTAVPEHSLRDLWQQDELDIELTEGNPDVNERIKPNARYRYNAFHNLFEGNDFDQNKVRKKEEVEALLDRVREDLRQELKEHQQMEQKIAEAKKIEEEKQALQAELAALEEPEKEAEKAVQPEPEEDQHNEELERKKQEALEKFRAEAKRQQELAEEKQKELEKQRKEELEQKRKEAKLKFKEEARQKRLAEEKAAEEEKRRQEELERKKEEALEKFKSRADQEKEETEKQKAEEAGKQQQLEEQRRQEALEKRKEAEEKARLAELQQAREERARQEELERRQQLETQKKKEAEEAARLEEQKLKETETRKLAEEKEQQEHKKAIELAAKSEAERRAKIAAIKKKLEEKKQQEEQAKAETEKIQKEQEAKQKAKIDAGEKPFEIRQEIIEENGETIVRTIVVSHKSEEIYEQITDKKGRTSHTKNGGPITGVTYKFELQRHTEAYENGTGNE